MNQPSGGNLPTASPNIVLAVVSLILGVIGLAFMIPTLLFTPCGIISAGFGIGAMVAGLLGMTRAKSDPAKWGGKGIAIGGTVVGLISVIAPVGYIILWMIIWFGFIAAGQSGR